MAFELIDQSTWPRRELFEYFRTTSLYLTVEVDITRFLACVKGAGVRFYPAAIHCIGAVINGDACFRTSVDEAGAPGVWDRVELLYTVPRRDGSGLFSMAVTPFEEEFPAFYEGFQRDYARAERADCLFGQGPPPANVAGVTALPGLHFTAFSFGDVLQRPDLLPFVLLGRWEERDGRVLLPVFGEFSHAVHDGVHVTRFFEELQARFDGFSV